jgi:predicted 3-demethylubiquinone-9 3-methyltransferase (glyoxalase superfamily)
MATHARPQRITPFLWFDGQAEAAAKFYVKIFPRSRITRTARYGEGGPGSVGSVMVVGFRLDGTDFLALNGGPTYTITPAISFVVTCQPQAEIDRVWDKLAKGGMTKRCGWLEDRFGVSWQVIPAELPKLIGRGEAMQALMGMDKIDITALREAAAVRVTPPARKRAEAKSQRKRSQGLMAIGSARS